MNAKDPPPLPERLALWAGGLPAAGTLPGVISFASAGENCRALVSLPVSSIPTTKESPSS